MDREYLTSNRTYYVRTDGSDSNDGLGNSSSGSFLTIQKAINTAIYDIDPGPYSVTIQVGVGTFSESIGLGVHWANSEITIQGSPTYGETVIVQGSSAHTISSAAPTPWKLKDLELRNTAGAAYACLYVANRGQVLLENVQWGSSLSHHIVSYYNGTVYFTSDYRIVGNPTSRHIFAAFDSSIRMVNVNCTLVGSRTFAQFININSGTSLIAQGFTYTGTATGNRWGASTNSAIFAVGSGSVQADFFPGSTNGSATSGSYIV